MMVLMLAGTDEDMFEPGTKGNANMGMPEIGTCHSEYKEEGINPQDIH
jgi:hypothetical protein